MVNMMSMEDIQATAYRLNVDLDPIDLHSIPLPVGEDLGILSDDDDLQNEYDSEFEEGFGNIIVVDNLPVVAKEKFEKLEGVVRKIYSQIGIIKEDGLWIPVDPDTHKTLGYCFIEFNTSQEAELAKEKTHGYKLDRSHKFSVYMFDDIDKYLKAPEEWAPPESKHYTPGENLQKWLTDEKARDQIVIRAGSDTEVLWNDARQSKPELVFKKNCWTDSFVQWSPLGTYLATLHSKGAVVWGGGATTFDKLMKFSHEEVKLIDFSPGENFLVTYSNPNPRDTHNIKIFNVRTGKVMREFECSADECTIRGASGVSWPVFRWGGGREDNYFARIGKNGVSVYETETFSLVDKKSMKVENVVDFSWSPTDSILALYVPELGRGNQPAKVSLVHIPSKQELRQKNLFSVSDCKMYWQSNGDYLAVKVDRYTKTKKSTYTGFELFRIKERDTPTEVVELENKNDTIIAFAWEPKGQRFAVIHGDINNPRPDVSFYSMRSGRVSKLTTLKGKQATALYWSPNGHFIVLAGLKSLNGQLEFYNVDELETMALAEHFMATDVKWDPTGR
ncbi:translation initiation factor 3B1 [Perilla frutescens var. frutescens]|nr:translation initiation factor 3B1 [Perilla frutescens var. frutescens]